MRSYKPYRQKSAALAFCIYLAASSVAQTTVVKDAPPVSGTTVVIPGAEYRRSEYHNFFWGRHYRKEWSTPVRVNDFYLDTAAGGLLPYAEGGGRQSKTLRLRNGDDMEYVLRSVNKDFGRALPEEMRGTVISRIAKDQASIGHPFAAITITPMARAAGIYHTNPVIVFVPAQPALGGYNDAYGDQLYLFEERPDGDHQGTASLGFSRNVIGSKKLWEHLYKDKDNQVDQEAFVRARLFDMFIGDWGRHPDNWRWAKFDTGKGTVYRPVPRDRDQAYTRIDGLYPSLAGSFYKPLQGFKHTIKGVKNWNLPGRPLDRMLLNGLERDVWISQATALQNVLTDSLITRSIRLLPPEIFAMSGHAIIEKLKSRRDHLAAYADVYYGFLARYIDLPGSQGREYFSINRLDGGLTEISIHKISNDETIRKEPFYTRRFHEEDTKEIRIYGLEDKDIIEVKGVTGSRIKIRIIDPDGTDSVVFQHADLRRKVGISAGRKFEYDTTYQEKLDLSFRPIISSSRYNKVFEQDPLKLFPRTGVKIVASITYNTQPWRKAEYENVHHVCANYGMFRKAFNVGYIGRFGRLAGKWDFLIKARLDAPAVENYFGTGNNTENATKDRGRNYYATYSRRIFGSIGVERDLSDNHHAELSLIYQSVKVQTPPDHFIANVVIDPALFEMNRYAGVEGGYSFTKANDRLMPTKGFGFNLGAGYIKNISENEEGFLKVLANSFVYIPLSRQLSLAVRAAGGTISGGDAPYYYLNTIGGGGAGEVRGYDRERFYGRHAAHLNNDLRWIFNTRNFLFNGRAGLLGFYDIGRVWQPGEISSLWHDSYGFGVILIPYNKFAVSATYGISAEGGYMHFKAGLFF